MRYAESWFYTTLGVVLSVGVITAGGCAKEPKAGETPKGYVIAAEDAIIALANQPGAHLAEARKNHESKRWKEAARELRTATAFMELEAARAEGKAKQGLDASSQRLKKLANDIDAGIAVTTEALDKEIAAASKALAVHHNAKATENWVKKEYRAATQDLKAASDYVMKAASWAGHAISAGADFAIDPATDAGQETIEAGKDAAEWSVDKIQKGIEWTGSAIEEVGKAMQK